MLRTNFNLDFAGTKYPRSLKYKAARAACFLNSADIEEESEGRWEVLNLSPVLYYV